MEPINNMLRQATEFGFLQYFEDRSKRIMHSVRRRQHKRQSDGNAFSMSSISFTDLDFVFYMYLFGMLGAIGIFCGELLLNRYRPHMKMAFIPQIKRFEYTN